MPNVNQPLVYDTITSAFDLINQETDITRRAQLLRDTATLINDRAADSAGHLIHDASLVGYGMKHMNAMLGLTRDEGRALYLRYCERNGITPRKQVRVTTQPLTHWIDVPGALDPTARRRRRRWEE